MMRLLVLILTVLFLAGCSSTRLAYNQVGWWAPWAARDYVSLDRSQRSLLREEIRAVRDWHCAEEIPAYADWFAARRADLTEGTPDEADAEQWLADALGAYDRLAEKITPGAIALLATLDDDQIDTLFESLEEKNRELEEEYRDPPLEEQIAGRAERLEERVENWFGSINDSQRAAIGEWSEVRGNQNSGWLDNRHRWQSELITALYQREDQNGFAEHMTLLIQSPEAVHTPEYSEQSQVARKEGVALAVRLLNEADEDQRKHLDGELARWQSRIAGLDCN